MNAMFGLSLVFVFGLYHFASFSGKVPKSNVHDTQAGFWLALASSAS